MANPTIAETKRLRVGGTGPRRDKLKLFHKIGNISDAAMVELNSILDVNQNNDLGGDSYSISKTINYDNFFNNGASYYRQILLQKRHDQVTDVDEYKYSNWDTSYTLTETQSEISKHFKNVYRFRLSEMQGNHEIKWHIDADTSVICRAQICLNANDSVFEFRDKHGIHQLKMKPGEIWFINTGWNHRVVNGSSLRRVVVLGFHYDDLISQDLAL